MRAKPRESRPCRVASAKTLHPKPCGTVRVHAASRVSRAPTSGLRTVRVRGIMAGSGSPEDARSCEPPLVPFGTKGMQPARATEERHPPPPGPKKRPKDTEMPKIKTHRGAAKRFRKTASGKYKAGHANRSHILTKMT